MPLRPHPRGGRMPAASAFRTPSPHDDAKGGSHRSAACGMRSRIGVFAFFFSKLTFFGDKIRAAVRADGHGTGRSRRVVARRGPAFCRIALRGRHSGNLHGLHDQRLHLLQIAGHRQRDRVPRHVGPSDANRPHSNRLRRSRPSRMDKPANARQAHNPRPDSAGGCHHAADAPPQYSLPCKCRFKDSLAMAWL